MTEAQLRLLTSELFSTHTDEEGIEDNVSFFVHVLAGAGEERIYGLTVMTERAYEAWYLEKTTGEPVEDEAFPLVIPEQVAAIRSLSGYVRDKYLDPSRPDQINQISKFLEEIRPASVVEPTAAS